MKITFDIDCTPEEARSFLGLPDVAPMNQAIMQEMEKKLRDNIDQFSDPQKFYEQMLQASSSNMESFANLFAHSTTPKSK